MGNVQKLVKMDFLKLLSLGKVLVLYLLFLLVFAADMRMISFGYMIFLYMGVYGPMSYDEASKGNYLLGTLPVSRKQVVQAKYLYALAVLLAAHLLIGLINLVIGLFPVSQKLESAMGALPVLFLLGAVFAAVVLPLVLYLGVMKARWWVMGLYMLAFMGGGTVLALSTGFGVSGPPQSASLYLVSAGLLMVSYFGALRLYSRRQFTE